MPKKSAPPYWVAGGYRQIFSVPSKNFAKKPASPYGVAGGSAQILISKQEKAGTLRAIPRVG